MKREDVPQDGGKLGPYRRVHYAVGDDGKYEAVPSAGFEPVNVANDMAWEDFEKQKAETREKIRKGQASPLAWHMLNRLMDPPLLAQYAGFSRRQTERALTPKGFARLTDDEIARFAQALDTTPEALLALPPEEEGDAS